MTHPASTRWTVPHRACRYENRYRCPQPEPNFVAVFRKKKCNREHTTGVELDDKHKGYHYSSRGNFDTTFHNVRPAMATAHTTQQTASHRPVQSPIHALSNEHSSEPSWARSQRQDVHVCIHHHLTHRSVCARPHRSWPTHAARGLDPRRCQHRMRTLALRLRFTISITVQAAAHCIHIGRFPPPARLPRGALMPPPRPPRAAHRRASLRAPCSRRRA